MAKKQSIQDLLNAPVPGTEKGIDAGLNHADRIAQVGGLDLFIHVGGLYADLKATWGAKDFEARIKDRAKEGLGVATRSISQYIQIAEFYGPYFKANPTHKDKLPQDRTSLCKLAGLDPAELAKKVDAKEVRAGLKRDEVRELVPSTRGAAGPKSNWDKAMDKFTDLAVSEMPEFLIAAKKVMEAKQAVAKKVDAA